MRIAHLKSQQQGAALMVMLVIMVVGIATVLVGSLNSSALNSNRQQQTSDALAKAKDALIGRASADAALPGSLPCPDNNDDGSSDSLGTNDCTSYIGRLPWRTLGLTELRDGTGEHLWYALSRNFRDYPSNHINSDTLGTLNITGTQSANNLVAIIFSAGNQVTAQNRSSTQTALCSSSNSTLAANLCASNYLEGSNANLSNATTPNSAYQIAIPTSTFNDQLLFISHDQLMAVIEKRIAREAKNCLDGYAIKSGGTYPWATPLSSTTLRPSMSGTYFGRFPDGNSLKSSTPNEITSLIDALNNLQVALTNYAASNNNSSNNALNRAGNNLQAAANNFSNNNNNNNNALANTANNTGQLAENLAQNNQNNNQNAPTVAVVQAAIDATQAALINYLSTNGWLIADANFSGCALFSSGSAPYWADWDDLIFYQVARGYQPNGTKSCGGNCLSLQVSGNPATGSGSYKAMVISAGDKLGATRNLSNAADYLEAVNLLPQNNASSAYKSYRLGDPNYQNVNDFALCVDGQVNCK